MAKGKSAVPAGPKSKIQATNDNAAYGKALVTRNTKGKQASAGVSNKVKKGY
jgi:hypothetical protein